MTDTTTVNDTNSDDTSATGTTCSGGVLPRPQAIGVFALPAGYLLIGSGHDETREGLVAGTLPERFSDDLRYYELALTGDVDGALAALGAHDVVDSDPVAMTNRLVLDPNRDALDALLAHPAVVDDPAWTTYVETIAFVVGLRMDPPDPEAADGEIAAMAHVAHATLALERSDRAEAIEQLEAASQVARPVSAALAGQTMGQLAGVQLDEGGTQRASVTYQAALDLLQGSDLLVSRAELHVAAGAMFQEMSEAAPRLMQQAINHYHQALALVNATTAPETFAIANANLGLAYITMPMTEASDQLRVGVAVQSMREALAIFTPETHLDRWSSTQLNLANALVYMPSKHQADNIAEAIGLYEGVLQHRDRQSDPQGRARVLANQGNAMAHLGVFGEAKGKLHEARAIFEEFEEDAAVRSVRSVLDEIAKQESIKRQDAEGTR